MSTIEVNLVLDLPDEINAEIIVNQIQDVISAFNGKQTRINVIETDNPITASPLNVTRGI